MNTRVLGIIDFSTFIGSNETFWASGSVVSDAKERSYSREYKSSIDTDSKEVSVQRADGAGDVWSVPSQLEITPELVSFFGLYSGDGSKGIETPPGSGIIKLHSVSFEQREVNLINFVVEQFRYLFGNSINFNFSFGEDSALFFEGDYYQKLKDYYGGALPALKELPTLKAKDKEYLGETRSYQTNSNENDLQFYYTHKDVMQEILTRIKEKELSDARIRLDPKDKITASLRKPFKKGARGYGRGSRSDGMSVKGTNGLGELFLCILHSIEDSILSNLEQSNNGLITWFGKPDEIGDVISTNDFFSSHPYGQVYGDRPELHDSSHEDFIRGKWKRSTEVKLTKEIQFSPKLCYISGLYLAEGTGHDQMVSMYHTKPKGFSFSFTSSEDQSLSLVISQIKKLIKDDSVVSTWKVKVGSQYFTELVSISHKLNIPMLRGGSKGQGKLKSVEISLSIRDWAMAVCPTMSSFKNKFTHVEPTGAGVARIDFSSPSPYCKWLFPIFMAAVFSEVMPNPEEFQ